MFNSGWKNTKTKEIQNALVFLALVTFPYGWRNFTKPALGIRCIYTLPEILDVTLKISDAA